MRPDRSQSIARDERDTQRRTAILAGLIAGAASLLLAGCGSSDRDEGLAAFPPLEQTASPETAWLADGVRLLDHPAAGLESAGRMPLGSATDLWHSGAPYAFEQIVPKA
jgi:hypothetical protein